MMMKLAWSCTALLLSLLVAAPASPQGRADPNCQDDRGVDRCDPEQQRRVRQLFGVISIEEHRAAGDQVRRVFYVDGYGGDVVAIAFIRSPGRDPEVWVHYPRRQGEPTPEPLRAPVPRPVWNDVIERGEHFDRDVLSRPAPAGQGHPAKGTAAAPEGQEMVLCIHSWDFTIEAVDRGRAADAAIRRKTEDGCEDGQGELYAQYLERIALSLIPHCAALDVSQYRNEAIALLGCAKLRGDRIAAAEVRNRVDPFFEVQGPEDARLIAPLFHDDAAIEWRGEQLRGAGTDPPGFWASRVRTEGARVNFFIETIEGLSSERVRLTGGLFRAAAAAAGEAARYESAAVEQIWTRVNQSDWYIERATVAPWRPVPRD
jgi:hypothetical protein